MYCVVDFLENKHFRHLTRLKGNLRNELGKGAYGTVYELQVHGDPCVYAGKKFRGDIFTPTVSAQKFVTEFVILSQLRHKNVVHYHGVTFIPPSKLSMLVMEHLQSDLSDWFSWFHSEFAYTISGCHFG